MRRRAFAYRRRASPLHATRAAAGGAYCAALAGAALIVTHPLVLGALLIAVLGAGGAAGVGTQMRRTLLVSAPALLVLTVAVNLLVDRHGLTVFARLGTLGALGRVDLTVEALVAGLITAARLVVVLLAGALFTTAVDPDEWLALLRRVSFQSALIATVATRLVPVLGEDAARLAEAQRCRPEGPAGGSRLKVLRAVVGGALDRSLDVAAALEVRGYGLPAGRRSPRPRRPLSRHDLAFVVAALGMLGLAVLAASGVAHFDPYPLTRGGWGRAPVLLSLAMPAVALGPFADRRGIVP